MQICTIPLTSILVEDRLRSVDAERAAQIALSFREAGQITPIEVTPEGADGLHRLIAGAHRVEAARLAGMDVIQAVIFEGSDDAGRLREIDENLYRRELSDLDRAAFLAERLVIDVRVHSVDPPMRDGDAIGHSLMGLGRHRTSHRGDIGRERRADRRASRRGLRFQIGHVRPHVRRRRRPAASTGRRRPRINPCAATAGS